MDESEDRIILMTLHSAKGSGVPVCVSCGNGRWSFPEYDVSDGRTGALEEERRLCYVGITRRRSA